MKTQKFIVATLVMAIIYLVVSYLFSLLFQQEFHWIRRVISAVAFGVIIVLLQYFISKKKKRRRP